MISDESPPSRPAAERVATTPGLYEHASRVLVLVAIVALAALLAYLRVVVALVFGSVLVAVALRMGSNSVRRVTGLGDAAALAVAVVATLALLMIGVVLLGDPIVEQFAALRTALPNALAATSRWLNSHTLGLWLLQWWHSADAGVEWTRVAGVAGNTIGAVGGVLLMLVMGLYLAADPELYRRGLLRLLPTRQRGRADRALCAAGNGLSRWLLGQAVAMVLVGAMTAIGLAAIGMPLALPLGIIAGILEFVPFFGAIVAGALTVLLAFTQGATQAAYALLVCVFVQHFEGYVIQPFVQRWAIALPPALGLISILVFGLLFGGLGVLLAVPLMVVLMILVQQLYIDGAPAAAPSGMREPHLSNAAPRVAGAQAQTRRTSDG